MVTVAYSLTKNFLPEPSKTISWKQCPVKPFEDWVLCSLCKYLFGFLHFWIIRSSGCNMCKDPEFQGEREISLLLWDKNGGGQLPLWKCPLASEQEVAQSASSLFSGVGGSSKWTLLSVIPRAGLWQVGITPMEPESCVYSSCSVLGHEGQGTATKRSQLQMVMTVRTNWFEFLICGHWTHTGSGNLMACAAFFPRLFVFLRKGWFYVECSRFQLLVSTLLSY